ncbi:MAG: hypothetical protein NZM25_01100 [Leptospiraceae bacterium]|nr:hypothetical protein [Leptospiraceae bacterium]MDW8306321.1 hypothetical protein [Leptospiraceae bacterium]
MRIWHLALFLLLTFLWLHIPWHRKKERFFLRPLVFRYGNEIVLAFSPKLSREIVFHIPAPDHSFAQCLRFSPQGEIASRFELPPPELVFPDGKKERRSSHRGYLTHPHDGQYFLWYPAIGNRILVFDRDGKLLWEKRESRYLLASPQGNYILAVSGDHSRFEVLTPAWESVVEAEGLLFTHFQFSLDKKESWLCASSLGTGIVLADLVHKKIITIPQKALIKSLYCNFKENYILLQEMHHENEKYIETLTQLFYKASERDMNFNNEILLTHEPTPASWLFAPITNDYFAVFLPRQDNPTLAKLLILKKNSKPREVAVSQELPLAEIRLYSFPLGLVFHTRHYLGFLDEEGITGLYRRKEIISVQQEELNLFLADVHSFSFFETQR